jgi:signal transduction histidine kinase
VTQPEESYTTPPEVSAARLSSRIDWLIKLRWMASVGLFAVITLVSFVLRVPLALVPLYSANLLLVLYNLICFIVHRRFAERTDPSRRLKSMTALANAQVGIDLTLLTLLIYFSGSLENPLIFYFIFHMIISSILLSNRAAYSLATYSLLLLGLVILGQYLRIIPHYHLSVFVSQSDCHLVSLNFVWIYLVLASTLYIAVYMTTTIVNELRVRQRDMEISNKKLEEQDRLKSRYVLTVSHDIQSSLSAVQSLLKVSLSEYAGTLSESLRKTLSRAEARCAFLLRFVKDLLNLSSMRSEIEIKKEPINILEVLDQHIDHFRSQIEQKKLSFSLNRGIEEAYVHGNRLALAQVIANLLSNAVKYTGEKGLVEVNVQKERGSDTVRIDFADSGIGIPAESLQHIFDDFYRAPNAKSSEHQGTGLGLSIVKRIIDMHAGKVTVESEPGQGTQFSVFLPLIKASPEVPNPA